jgi:hypothetical protein
MSDLYEGMAASPVTYLSSGMTASQNSFTVSDGSALPDAPNICTIGYGRDQETVKYGTKDGGSLGDVERGVEGTAKAWQAGQEVARYFTAYDHLAILEQVQPLATPPGWIDATLQNGWTGFVRYRKNAVGQIELMGRLIAGSGGIKSVVTVLPYYPQVTTAIPCVILQTGNTYDGLQLRSNGEIRNYRDNMIVTDEHGFTAVMPI